MLRPTLNLPTRLGVLPAPWLPPPRPPAPRPTPRPALCPLQCLHTLCRGTVLFATWLDWPACLPQTSTISHALEPSFRLQRTNTSPQSSPPAYSVRSDLENREVVSRSLLLTGGRLQKAPCLWDLSHNLTLDQSSWTSILILERTREDPGSPLKCTTFTPSQRRIHHSQFTPPGVLPTQQLSSEEES